MSETLKLSVQHIEAIIEAIKLEQAMLLLESLLKEVDEDGMVCIPDALVARLNELGVDTKNSLGPRMEA